MESRCIFSFSRLLSARFLVLMTMMFFFSPHPLTLESSCPPMLLLIPLLFPFASSLSCPLKNDQERSSSWSRGNIWRRDDQTIIIMMLPSRHFLPCKKGRALPRVLHMPRARSCSRWWRWLWGICCLVSLKHSFSHRKKHQRIWNLERNLYF